MPLSFVAMIFAFSTMLAWAYYGIKGWTYLVGEGKNKEKAFGLVFCLFIIIGATIKLDTVLEFADQGNYLAPPKIKPDRFYAFPLSVPI